VPEAHPLAMRLRIASSISSRSRWSNPRYQGDRNRGSPSPESGHQRGAASPSVLATTFIWSSAQWR